jgi:uncharacterized membrane protein
MEGINDSGAIVGSFAGPSNTPDIDHGYLLFNGKFTRFRFPGSKETEAHDINNVGQIVGGYIDSNNKLHGFVVHSSGFKTVDFPGAVATEADGINDAGDIVGFVIINDVPGNSLHSFLLHNGVFTKFSFPGADPNTTFAKSINIHGTIVGTYDHEGRHGFMVRNGVFTTLDFPGAFETEPAKINNFGDVVGSYVSVNDDHSGFAFDHGRFITVDQSGTFFNQIMGVNNKDQIVGSNSSDAPRNSIFFKANCQKVF